MLFRVGNFYSRPVFVKHLHPFEKDSPPSGEISPKVDTDTSFSFYMHTRGTVPKDGQSPCLYFMLFPVPRSQRLAPSLSNIYLIKPVFLIQEPADISIKFIYHIIVFKVPAHLAPLISSVGSDRGLIEYFRN